ncbi:MAG: VanZ family protein [Oscillospiraceae bacterium]|nr:VanZ family protein [Oscillospiraceae bacterium]
MRRTDKRVRLCTCLICLVLIFIWGNSLMNAEASSRISGWVGRLLGSILNLSAEETEGGHGLLRKLAHFSEFALLGLLLCWRLGMAGKAGKELVCLTMAGGLAAACVDETIQIFVSGRSSSLIDVWIDTGGALAGMIFLILGHHFVITKHGK